MFWESSNEGINATCTRWLNRTLGSVLSFSTEKSGSSGSMNPNKYSDASEGGMVWTCTVDLNPILLVAAVLCGFICMNGASSSYVLLLLLLLLGSVDFAYVWGAGFHFRIKVVVLFYEDRNEWGCSCYKVYTLIQRQQEMKMIMDWPTRKSK